MRKTIFKRKLERAFLKGSDNEHFQKEMRKKILKGNEQEHLDSFVLKSKFLS